MMMKVAHVAVVTPHRAGLYETARDLVAAERRAGVDARIIDPVKAIEMVDRGSPVVGAGYARECDVLVNHSGLSAELNALRLPVVHVLHGRPHSSFLLEQSGEIKVLSYLTRVREDVRFRAFVTFWPEFLPYWEVLLPRERLHAVAAPVDLERWTPHGPDGYEFHGQAGDVNVVCSSMWRADETPFHVINAFYHFALGRPGARLHVYGAPQGGGSAWGVLEAALRERGMLGEVVGMVTGLENVYRAADAVIVPHRIATRSVREPLACGCNVVMAPGNSFTPFVADPQDLAAYAAQIARAVSERVDNRRVARVCFDAERAAGEFISLLARVIDGFK